MVLIRVFHFRRSLLTSIVVVLTAVACSRDPRPDTPAAAAEGERLMRQMSETLAGVSAFRFTTTENLEQVGPSENRRVLHFARTVTVRRPNGVFFELHGLGDTALDVGAYYDGSRVSLRGEANNVWAQTTAPGTLDEMLDEVARRFSLPVPIADVIYSAPYDAFIGRNTHGGFVGREIVEGVQCAKLAYSDEFVDVRVWIPTSAQPLPRREEIAYKQVRGVPTARITFTSWDLQPRVSDATFTFQPEAALTRIEMEEFVAGVASGGQPAVPVGTTAKEPGKVTAR